jgi:3-oxoacyl-[acyl-carrier-protein] synthase-3
MAEAATRAIEQAGLTPADIDLVIPHQANVRILNAVGSYLGCPEKIMSNVDRFGNTSAASIGIALDEAIRTGRVRGGNIVCLVAFGGGLTWASMVVRL